MPAVEFWNKAGVFAMRFVSTVFGAAAFLACGLGYGEAQSQYGAILIQKQALLVIADTAKAICIEIEQSGTESTATLSGSANATLNDAINKVSNLNISGNAQLNSVEYHGVVRSQLADTLAHAQACRRAVFETLVTKMLPPISAVTGLSTQQSIRLRPRTNERPSFDCNNARETVEQLICADADVAEWDGRLGVAYRQAMGRLSPADQAALRQQQRDWIKQRDATCRLPARGASLDEIAPSKPCILQVVRQRLAQLGG